ncbi:interleukin-1 receptor type 2-like [Parambassis ranga]|uniref:Interleukin-1 receptor type 2-like n=1 Tax=Parambassis ranga TaxID=210632 RepID=A0A6P7H7X0_9TELE|nr:interleukin-1 receptor type 2-like [Parambassis ranga]
MVYLTLILGAVLAECVNGRPPLPPLPMKDGCYLVSPEVEIFRVESEAVILYFPMFMRVLETRNIALPSAQYLITKNNGTEVTTYQGEGRVQQRNKQLWFLPAHASDSGEYTCTYRNETYCITGSIELYVYESSAADMEKLSYPVFTQVGEELDLRCPSLSYFNKTDRQIEWYKDSTPTTLQAARDSGKLMIPAIKRSHAGAYTCHLRVLINDQQYTVSRVILLNVQGTDPPITTTTTTTTTVPELSTNTDPMFSSSNTANTPLIPPPVIVSPLNGTIVESSHGSGMEIFCQVLTECHIADSTMVMWLVNGQSVESSYLERRAIQGGRRVTRVSERCQIELRLVVAVITEEDEQTELKCVTQNTGGRQEVVAKLQLEDHTFTWVVVAAVGMSCFLAVVSVFIYVLFKPKKNKKMDYFLARQSSTF